MEASQSSKPKRKRSDGFTEPQRQWILARDDHACQLCSSDVSLQVHHIVPWRWAATVLMWTLERVNNPTNGIVLCKECHISGRSAIHADIARANTQYKDDKAIYSKVFAARDELCRRQMPYWCVAYDNQMSVTAVMNTLRYVSEGNYPTPWNKEEP